MCYACGDVEAGVYVDPTACVIPSSESNATKSENDAKLIPCINGVCYVSFCCSAVEGTYQWKEMTA